MLESVDGQLVIGIAKDLGFRLTPEEAGIYAKHLARQIESLDLFIQSRALDSSPLTDVSPREPAYRPSRQEDPLNVWMWKCRIGGEREGILADKTVSFKDHIAVRGIPISFGSLTLDGLTPDFDATVVSRVLAAGGTVVGKNVMDGLSGGFGYGGAVGDFGRPLNPHENDHVTGGSSSGSAAAVASGGVDISFGGDQGGSIRIPAAFCGTVGLKPTFGLVSHFGAAFGSDQSIDHIGPMSLTVLDAAKALQATAGYDPRDPRQSRDVPEEMDVLSGISRGVSGLRIGLLQEGFAGADDPVQELVLRAVDVLAEAGAEISEISVPVHDLVRDAHAPLFNEGVLSLFRSGIFGASAKTHYPENIVAAVDRLFSHEADSLAPRLKIRLLAGELGRRRYHGRGYAKAHNVRPAFIEIYNRQLRSVDLLVMPTVVTTAPANTVPRDYLEALEQNLGGVGSPFTRNVAPFSYTGHPALAIPVGLANGLPVSMQLVGRAFDDGLLLRAGHAYQQLADSGRLASGR